MEIAAVGTHCPAMLSTADLLRALEVRKVKKERIAEVLGIDPAGVSRLYSAGANPRQLKLDEAKKLVEAFNLEAPPTPSPLPIPIARLAALYCADSFGVAIDQTDPRIEEVARDLRAFSMFAADPRVRESTEAVQGFFQGLRLAPDRTGRA
jgi:hypothetical protein